MAAVIILGAPGPWIPDERMPNATVVVSPNRKEPPRENRARFGIFLSHFGRRARAPLFALPRVHQSRASTSIVTSRIRSANNLDLWWPPGPPREIYKPVGLSLPFFMNGSVARMSVGFGLGTKVRELLSPKNFDIVHLHSPLFGTLPILANYFFHRADRRNFHTSFPGSANLTFLEHAASGRSIASPA